MMFTAVRGTKDYLPNETEYFRYIEDTAKRIFSIYGYKEIRTPIFEATELYLRSTGEATEVVTKQMYTFTDKKGRSLTLRPEGTPSVVRAYIEHKIYAQKPLVKFYYIGPMFRYERPQAGRLRQHTQIGVEAFGSASASLDAEIIAVFFALAKELKLNNFILVLNSVGCEKDSCQARYKKALKDYLADKIENLCNDCKERFLRNPLRILDCKNPICAPYIADSPKITDFLCSECSEHFDSLKEYLDKLNISYQLNHLLVRGLDYYTKTVFEFIYLGSGFGTQNAIGGGGRYDNLVASLGGPNIPAIGFSIGLERLYLALQNEQIKLPGENSFLVFIADRNEEKGVENYDRSSVLAFAEHMRMHGIPTELDHRKETSLSAKLKLANQLGATYAIILNADNFRIKEGLAESDAVCIVKDMRSGKQEEVPISQIVNYFLAHKTGK